MTEDERKIFEFQQDLFMKQQGLDLDIEDDGSEEVRFIRLYLFEEGGF